MLLRLLLTGWLIAGPIVVACGQEDLDLEFRRVALVNQELIRYGASVDVTPRSGESWQLIFRWAPNAIEADDVPGTLEDFPSLASLRLNEVQLDSNYLPEVLVHRLQEIETGLDSLSFRGNAITNAQVSSVLNKMKASVGVLRLTCPRVSPEILESINSDKIGYVVIVGDQPLRLRFLRFVDESDKKFVPVVLLPPLKKDGSS